MSTVEIAETVDTVSDELVEAPLVVEESKRRIGPLDIIGPVVVLAIFVGWWYFMHHWALKHWFDREGFLMPPWHEILYDSFVRRIPQPGGGSITKRTDLLNGLLQTTKLVLVGFSISIGLGMTLAFLMTPARWLERSLWPYLVALQAIPILAISPVIGAIFDYQFRARLLVVVIISIVPIVSNTLFGLRSVDQGQHDLFTLRDVSPVTRLFKLQLPSALPAIFTGFRISSGLAVIGAIVGELFNRQGDKGIGTLMEEFRSRNQYTYTYGCLLLSSLLGIAVFFLFGWLQKLATGKWHEAAQTS
jgi:NitT/TauT family transport system permease protein